MAKIVFIQNVLGDYLGVMSMASLLKKHGHNCDLFIDGLEMGILESIKKSSPHIVGFPVLTGTHHWALRIAKKVKESLGVLTLFGGVHATIYPEIIEYPQVDIVCRGEGEYPVLELLDCIENGKDYNHVYNLWVKKDGQIFKNEIRPLMQDLSALPFPDRGLYYKYKPLRNFPTKLFLVTRGCPLRCAFCHNHLMAKIYEGKGKYLRSRSIDNVIDEIKEVKERYLMKTLYFVDDTFTTDHHWLFMFLDRYKQEINLPFSCNITANTVNEDIIKYLSEHGCFHVRLGIETGNERLRMEVLKKPIKNEQIIKAAHWIKKYGLKLITSNMLGIPGETVDEALQTFDINRRIKSDAQFFSICQPYPKTEIADYALRKGYVDEITPDKVVGCFFRGSILKQDNIKELVNLQKFFLIAITFPRLIPLIRKLIKLPPNRFFEFIFTVSMGNRYFRIYNMNLVDVCRIGFVDSFKFFKYLWRWFMSKDKI